VLADVAAALREEERVAWQRLIRVLSHEINNSLTPIKSLAGSLRTRIDNPNPAELHRGLTVIEERAASLNRFLQAYQRLTRLPAPTLATVPVGPLLEQVAHLETRLAVEVEPGPTLSVLGDPDQLQHLLINLVRNAVEAAQTAAHPSRVTASWSASGQHAIIRIRDNGPGLLNPANIFVPFYTTKPEGSGIGLVLAQQIASAHRGSVTLANNPDGTGCTAELRLPAAL
jgi:signal transduction histidine kinase